jgi:hypothetical protein
MESLVRLLALLLLSAFLFHLFDTLDGGDLFSETSADFQWSTRCFISDNRALAGVEMQPATADRATLWQKCRLC